MSIGRIEKVATRAPALLLLSWDDGFEAELDLSAVIAGKRVLAPLGDAGTFRDVILAEDGWSVEWPACGIDLGAPQLRRWAEEQAGGAMSATRFRHWMEGHGLTLDRAAEALGLSRRTVAYYLSGEQPVPKTVMLATEGYDRRQAA